jgi:hypothetical protein
MTGLLRSSMLFTMKHARSIALIALLIAAAATLARALIERDRMGVAEYVIGIALVLALVGAALYRSRAVLQSR